MEYLSNEFTLEISAGAFPLSTDSMVLSHYAVLPKQARVLDLGSGCGTLGILLCAKDPACTVTGLEISERAHRAALENIRRNGLSSRMKSICADLRSVSEKFPPGQFSCCISNPPYFSGGPASRSLPLARREDSCSLEELLSAAAWALKFGGDFFLVHRPERLGQIIADASKVKLEAKRLCLVRHREGDPVSLILVQLRKGARPGLRWEELTLYHKDGTPTQDCRRIYHMKENEHGRNAVPGTHPHRQSGGHFHPLPGDPGKG